MGGEVFLLLEGGRRPERLADLTLELAGDLRRQSSVQVRQASRASETGERAGEVPLLGQIILAFLTAGAAKALVDCLKSYIERDRNLQFRLKRADGIELSLDAKNLDPKVIDSSIRTIERFLNQ